MNQELKIELAKKYYEKIGYNNVTLEIKRDDEINADYIWTNTIRGVGALIIDDNGECLFCPSSLSYDVCKEDFKKGMRSNI